MAGGSDRLRRILAACAAAPPLAALAINVAILVPGAGGGTPPFWRGGSLTLSEAAALHEGELVRLIAAGTDPNARYPLRPGVLAVTPLTPLEAAVGARRAEMVELLMLHGATMDSGNWTRLRCFAIETGAPDVVAMVGRYRPAGARESCDDVATPF